MTTKELVSGNERRSERPDPNWVRGECPCCGEAVVSNAYYVSSKGGAYFIVWECWGSLAEPPVCDYRRVL
jgi:hypothetical protein